MKRVLISSLAVVALLFSVIILSSPRSQAQAGLISAVLQRMENNYKTLRTLKSEIGMQKYNAQAREAENYAGYLHYVPGQGRSGNIRLDWKSPYSEIFTFKAGQYMLYRPRLNTAYVGKATPRDGNVGGLAAFFSMSGSELRQQFDAQVVGNETIWGNVATTKLYLVPKGKASYASAEIWVDGSGMPVQVKVNEKNNDYSLIRIYDIKRNENFGDVFTLPLDKSVKIVKS